MKISKGIITSAVILLISGISFASGFLREGVVNEIEELKITIADDETLVERIDNKISDMLISDQLTTIEATDEIAEAKHLAQVWAITFDNSTQLERVIYLGELQTKVNRYERLIRDSYVGRIVNHFLVEGNVDDYFLANSSFDGFNYTITKQQFDNYESTYDLANLYPTIEAFLFSYGFRNHSDIADRWAFHLDGDRTRVQDLDVWANMYRSELYTIQQELANYTNEIASLETIVSYYSFGITAITITTILATAMANRISDKESEKEFSHVKAKILESEKWLITRTRLWPMTLLFFALILSIAALAIPAIYGLLT